MSSETDEGTNTMSWTFPLTGLATDHVPNNRVVAVMINNYPKARPQTGLYKADLVYEVLAEGDITRFLALYQSEEPEKVGPVRSARDYFIDLSNGFDALYICHGWSPKAQQMLQSGAVDYFNGFFYDGTLFKRDPSRKAPHNSYVSFENMKKEAEKKGYRLEGEIKPLPFFENEQMNGQSVHTIDIFYSKQSYAHVRYTYDGDKYIRYSGGVQTVDRETKTPIAVQNVFVVEMEHKVVDNEGRRDINLTSGGKAYLFQKGTMQQVEWKNVDGRILPYKDGIPLGFVPGKIWINVVPTLNEVHYE
ncbi:DUF3048 family protein [Thermolongibacillus altinsuensis]|uniref:DUF3048 family protein n=1 Tax=Thermolongibacillus altinsuensis TaxID=575256 RepID=A0A4R1QB53_9BACL|nr:DUF3048 domain-containing protein [Thermolongibacillus altinsuensis]TCL44784.1 DUF3048 family protein [Thermolongibacillus altinsuensis]